MEQDSHTSMVMLEENHDCFFFHAQENDTLYFVGLWVRCVIRKSINI